MKLFLALCVLPALALAQNQGTEKTESPLDYTWQECTAPGSCTPVTGGIALDANWRWTHDVASTTNCYTGNLWDPTLCPDSATCTENCAVDGIPPEDWEATYGVSSTGESLSIRFKTEGQYSTNIGSRMYLLAADKTNYQMFNLLNKEFTFDVDDSQLDCGLNGALYFVEMQEDGGLSEYATNDVGAAYGTGYCDAQCPHDIKWIEGEANSDEWEPSDNDANAGKGKYGACCAEMDIWEANFQSQAYTTHPCDLTGQLRCEGTDCGDNDADERYEGVCDKDGCDFASYRLGDTTFWGAGSGFTVDSSRPVTVVTQFLTEGNSDTGALIEIRRKYVQDGVVIENSVVAIDGVEAYDSITEDMCNNVKDAFGDFNDHQNKGGLQAMGEALGRGMVLVMSLWDDHEAFMLWLDSDYPTDVDPSTPGVSRGPCPTTSGQPEDVEAEQADATVIFSNVRFGAIDSTYG